jgi:para-aminobenzoate synthetase/4-amino-4-deoxychorismate lyase
LLDDSLTPGGTCALYEDPVEIVCCDAPEDAEAALDRIAGAGARGLHAAGFLSYELGYLLEPRLAPLLPPERHRPLIWMGLFAARRDLDAAAAAEFIAARAPGGDRAGEQIDNLRPGFDREAYLARARKVKDYIAAGDVYQINLTFKMLFEFAGDPLALYGELRRRQRVAHGAFIRATDFDVLSLSPELFLSVAGGRALAKPMKGTAARGATPQKDAARAENLMIVDLLRNDLSRVAEIGSVAVPELFAVESYPTLHQMTSSVTARLRPDVDAGELIRSLFPCGSITGAPKVRAMEIIHELEPAPRGVYTGAIGAIEPGGELAFNVAIRTLVVDRDGRGEMGIGSGIVYDSDLDAEYEETLLKARFLSTPAPDFQLIETLRWSSGEGYVLIEEHLARLAASAARFAFPCARDKVLAALDEAVTAAGGNALRLRLLLDRDGGIEATAAPLPPQDPDAVWRYAISECRTDPADPLLYHKTTRRTLYDGERARLAAETGCDEVVFLNTRGEVTEGAISTVFVEHGGRLATPPLACGLLPGTLRQSLLGDSKIEIEERILRLEDLTTAEAVYLGNSVRGLIRAAPVEAAASR